MTYILFFVGLVGLFAGGEFLVRGAVGIARRAHLSPLVIGLTVVAFGTSAPELLVSVQAALAGTPAIAIGNVMGSNIANVLLILGVAAVIIAVPMKLADMRRDIVTMIGATLLLWVMLADGNLARWEGAVLFGGLVGYVYISLAARRETTAPSDTTMTTQPFWSAMLTAIGGLAALMVGARFLVDSATEIAHAFGVSEAVIGLTIVAIGTSLPEMATSVIAAVRRHPEIAVGNIIGSCIFNILAILGVTALIAPVPVEPRFYGVDMIVMLISAVLILLFAAYPERVNRTGGVLLLLGYGGYLIYLIGT